MKDLIHGFVKAREYVTFPELTRWLSRQGFNTEGDHAISVGEDPNLLLWINLAEPVATAVRELIQAQSLYVHPSDLLPYVADGGVLTMPIAKRPPRRGYRDPHWAPVTLCSFPYQPRAVER